NLSRDFTIYLLDAHKLNTPQVTKAFRIAC
ncbi:MAG: hypothetical protein ACJAUX_000874, partial [Flavobacteriales bacterium]